MMFAAGLGISGQVLADEALAKAKNCMSCHAIDKKLVGPAYKDVAAMYKGCLLYTSPSPRDRTRSRMPSSA